MEPVLPEQGRIGLGFGPEMRIFPLPFLRARKQRCAAKTINMLFLI